MTLKESLIQEYESVGRKIKVITDPMDGRKCVDADFLNWLISVKISEIEKQLRRVLAELDFDRATDKVLEIAKGLETDEQLELDDNQPDLNNIPKEDT